MSDSQINHSFARFFLMNITNYNNSLVIWTDLFRAAAEHLLLINSLPYTEVAEKLYVKRVVCHNSQHS